jgi:hypothetical protein
VRARCSEKARAGRHALQLLVVAPATNSIVPLESSSEASTPASASTTTAEAAASAAVTAAAATTALQ